MTCAERGMPGSSGSSMRSRAIPACRWWSDHLPAIDVFAVSVHVNGGVRGALRAEARDEKAAEQLRDVVRGAVAAGQLMGGKNKQWTPCSLAADYGQRQDRGCDVLAARRVPRRAERHCCRTGSHARLGARHQEVGLRRSRFHVHGSGFARPILVLAGTRNQTGRTLNLLASNSEPIPVYDFHMHPSVVVVVGAARTPIGRYGGTLRDTHPAELGARAARAASIAPVSLPIRSMKCSSVTRARPVLDRIRPRQTGRRAGLPDEVPAQTINQACASGLQAIALGAQAIQLAQSRIVLSGGIESMSRMPYFMESEDARWGHKMGNFKLVDAMSRDGFFCPLSQLLMGQTAEVLARHYGITREVSDAFALGSQQKAEAAIAAGQFAEEITPAPGKDAKGKPVELSVDEHPRSGSTIEGLRKLPLVFEPVDGAAGIITAGTSSGITDGGAAVVLAEAGEASRRGLTPLARIVGWATAGVDPRMMGIGPVPAVRKLLQRTGLRLEDFDLVELNEAFAPQVLAVLRDLPIDPARVNVNGGAIALGHPIGCTGTRIVVTLLHEMRRRKARRGLRRYASAAVWGWRWHSPVGLSAAGLSSTPATRHSTSCT